MRGRAEFRACCYDLLQFFSPTHYTYSIPQANELHTLSTLFNFNFPSKYFSPYFCGTFARWKQRGFSWIHSLFLIQLFVTWNSYPFRRFFFVNTYIHVHTVLWKCEIRQLVSGKEIYFCRYHLVRCHLLKLQKFCEYNLGKLCSTLQIP